jgi:hypothetical protein
MIVKANTSGWKQTKWYEFALRFAIGGLITVGAGLIAKRFGPAPGGLFLAFPAIFPASATLIAKHETQRKAKKKLHGEKRGVEAAALDACGAAMGSVGLAAFAFVNWALLRSLSPVEVLAAATAVWFAVAWLTWLLRRVWHRRRAL